MTLHEAIEEVLKQKGKPLLAKEIALILNENHWYTEADRSRIQSGQISARVNNYPSYFFKRDKYIYLNYWKENTEISKANSENINNNDDVDTIEIKIFENKDYDLKVNPAKLHFLQYNNFTNIGTLDDLMTNGLPHIKILNKCGIYAISIPNDYKPAFYSSDEVVKNGNVIKPWTIDKLKNKWVKDSDIIYYGLAGKISPRSLKERLIDLIRHGNGGISTSGPHKGGEILWQLKGYESFTIWILPTGSPPEPKSFENAVLKLFQNINEKLPFANRQL